MKVTLRTIAGLLSSAVMVSCSNVNDDPNISQTPIDFGTTVSRAAVADKSELSSFSVWGGYQGVEDLFDGTVVDKNGAYTDGTRYWIPGKTFNFYAVHPATLPSGATANVTDVAGNGIITVTDFDCSKFGTEAVDLMTASRIGMDGSNPEKVALTFKHALTRITFSAKLADRLDEGYSLQVNEVALWASNKGTMKQDINSPTNNQPIWTTEPYLIEGEDESDIVNDKYNAYLYRLTTENGALKDQTIQIGQTVQLNAESKGDLLVVPQNMIETRPVLAIRYALGYNGSYTEPMWKVYYLKNTTTNWTPGSNLNYTFTIDENNVYFEIKIYDWVSGNKGNENIDFI